MVCTLRVITFFRDGDRDEFGFEVSVAEVGVVAALRHVLVLLELRRHAHERLVSQHGLVPLNAAGDEKFSV